MSRFGWRPDLEDRKFLHEQATRFRMLPMREIPDKVDPRGKIKIKNQGQVGACAGFSRSSCMEALSNGIGGEGIELSPMFAYLSGQKVDGLLGRDVGSTIAGNIKAASQWGNAPDATFRFPGRYTSQIPEACWEAAKPHKLLAHQPVRSADECRQAIGSGYPVYLGIMWGNECNRPIVDNYSGSGGGGHAICLLGYVGDYFLMLNSWGEQWGDRGWARWHTRAVDQMIRSRNSDFVIVSEIANPTPRQWNYDKDLILG